MQATTARTTAVPTAAVGTNVRNTDIASSPSSPEGQRMAAAVTSNLSLLELQRQKERFIQNMIAIVSCRTRMNAAREEFNATDTKNVIDKALLLINEQAWDTLFKDKESLAVRNELFAERAVATMSDWRSNPDICEFFTRKIVDLFPQTNVQVLGAEGLLRGICTLPECKRWLQNAITGAYTKNEKANQLNQVLGIYNNDYLCVKLFLWFHLHKEFRIDMAGRLTLLAELVNRGDLDKDYLEKCFRVNIGPCTWVRLEYVWPIPLLFLRVPSDRIRPEDISNVKEILFQHKMHSGAIQNAAPHFLEIPGSFMTRAQLVKALSSKEMLEQDKESFLQILKAYVPTDGVTDEVLARSIEMFASLDAKERTSAYFNRCIVSCKAFRRDSDINCAGRYKVRG